ncbi:MAG: VWA domain-containing protein [Elusimicrobia bacterium]|nr:VWA domain-containing protein [Elusimicrobiota bacterium]
MDLFRSPSWLAWLAGWAALAFAVVRFASNRRERLIRAFGLPETLSRLTPPETAFRRSWKTGLLLSGTGLLFVALAGPQWGVELVTTEAKGSHVLLAVDTSNSMRAEDVPPSSRMEKAKNQMRGIIDGLKGQRVGVIAFSGRAQLVCPLTTDVEAAKTMLDRVEVGMIPQQGTAIGDALELATKILGKYPGHKAVVVFSDGEDRRGDPVEAARDAVKAGVRLFVVGVGTPEGGPIPNRDASGALTGYLKDKAGETVVSRLAEQAMIRLAGAGEGAYYRATPQESETSAILKHLSELDRSRIQGGSANQFKNRYRLPLFLAILLLVAELLVPERTKAEPPEKDRRKRPAVLGGKPAALAALAFLLSGCGAPAAFDLWGGNRSYAKGEYEAAAKRYAEAGKAAPHDARPGFNSGAADYKRGELEAAADAFTKVAEAPQTPKRVAPSSWYNLGNTKFRQEDYGAAAEAYRRCLLLDPQDEDCRFNLVLALRAKKQPPPKQDQKDQKQDKKDDKGQQPPPPQPKPRPKAGEMSQEDAERILQAIQEKEKATMRQQQAQQKAVKPPPQEEDW